MYYPNQSSSSRRSGEEFLRRMTRSDAEQGVPCAAFRNESSQSCGCSGSESGGDQIHHCIGQSSTPQRPALAMVYCPVQEWVCLMDSPEKALSEGTLFQELVKPFVGGGIHRSARY